MLQEKNMWPVQIVRSRRKTVSIEVKPREILVRVPLFVSDADIGDLLKRKEEWILKHQLIVEEKQRSVTDVPKYTQEEINVLAEKAVRIIPEKVRFYAERIGVDYGRITIRCQKTRWGSCSGKGNLNFNCILMEFSDEVIDSVVVHELCHRKHMNHSAEFYAEVERVLPNYKQCHRWLKENGSRFLHRLP